MPQSGISLCSPLLSARAKPEDAQGWVEALNKSVSRSGTSLILPEIKNRLYGYIREVANDQKVTIIAMNGMSDHIHILLGVKPTMCLADILCHIKTTSSKWAQKTFLENTKFGWQGGYGAFSVGLATLPAVKGYIQNQEKHHQTQTYEEEFISFLKAHRMEYDPRFVLD